MRIYDEIWGVAEDNYGIITSAQAEAMGIARTRLVTMEKRGALVRIGYGVYQVKHHVPGKHDSYALGVAMAGRDAFLRGASVLGLLALAPIDLSRLYLGTFRRVRRRLPRNYVLKKTTNARIVEYHGIKSESVAEALKSAIADGALDADRVAEAAETANREGYLTDCELNDFKGELK